MMISEGRNFPEFCKYCKSEVFEVKIAIFICILCGVFCVHTMNHNSGPLVGTMKIWGWTTKSIHLKTTHNFPR